MSAADALRAGLVGLRTRRLRAALSGIGVAIGIGAMVAVLGISESSKADLLQTLDRLGTNLLRVTPGQSFLGEDAALPEAATAMTARVPGVRRAAAVTAVGGITVRRTPYVPEAQTGGISVLAADPALLSTVGGRLRRGRFLDSAGARLPVVVLGADTARRLGIDRTGLRVWVGDRWFTVGGILEPVSLAPGLDAAALVGYEAAERLLGAERSPSTLYARVDPSALDQARKLLGAAASPQRPEEVEVSRPSDAIAARAAARTAFTSLFLGLGLVALLVGGVGIANVMVVAVLERRSEIGLRRALGATRRDVGVQFLAESVLLAGGGGVAGALLGAAVTAGWAASEGQPAAIPPEALAGGAVAAIAIGIVAGLYPALRAARLAPSEALRTT